jgi:ubiquinone/menaquinone biosynthesis C-methylase UbiE
MPVKVDPAARFWDRIAERYARRPVADEATYQRKLAKTREYLRPDMQVLELGCGTGSTAIAHAPYVAHVRAIDVSPSMIAIARAKAQTASISNVDFEVSNIDDLEVPDGSVDAVLLLSVLHLLEDKTAVIRRVHRMLRPGGVLVTSTPCLRDAWKYVAIMTLAGPLGRRLGFMPEVVHMFTMDALVATIADVGFDIEQRWRPARDKAAFIVGRKRGDSPALQPDVAPAHGGGRVGA